MDTNKTTAAVGGANESAASRFLAKTATSEGEHVGIAEIQESPYCLLNLGEGAEPDPDDDERIDDICLMLPLSTHPDLSALLHEEVDVDGEYASFDVECDGFGIRWLDNDGVPVRIGSAQAPLAQVLLDQVQSPDGCLVCFIDELDANPSAWSIFRAL